MYGTFTLKQLLEVAGVANTPRAVKLIESLSQNTHVSINGDEYVVPGSWDQITAAMSSDARDFIAMMSEMDDDLVITPTSDTPTTSLEEFIDVIDVATTSAEMDHWTPPSR